MLNSIRRATSCEECGYSGEIKNQHMLKASLGGSALTAEIALHKMSSEKDFRIHRNTVLNQGRTQEIKDRVLHLREN